MKIIKTKTLFFVRGSPVILQELADDYSKYCVQYCGGGKYFRSSEEAAKYISSRFKQNITNEAIIDMEKAFGKMTLSDFTKLHDEIVLRKNQLMQQLHSLNPGDNATTHLIELLGMSDPFQYNGVEEMRLLSTDSDELDSLGGFRTLTCTTYEIEQYAEQLKDSSPTIYEGITEYAELLEKWLDAVNISGICEA